MAYVTYTREPHGFGVVYDAAMLARVDDPADPRLAAAGLPRIPLDVTASVLFTPRGADAAGIAAGRVPSQLIATDDVPLPAHTLSTWDWDEVALRVAVDFCERSGADSVEATALYWRGYPVLQLTTVATPRDEQAADSAVRSIDGDVVDAQGIAARETFALLYTPLQTFASLLTIPTRGLRPWDDGLQSLMNGFFLWPLEREGRVRCVHQFVWSTYVRARDLRGGLATR